MYRAVRQHISQAPTGGLPTRTAFTMSQALRSTGRYGCSSALLRPATGKPSSVRVCSHQASGSAVQPSLRRETLLAGVGSLIALFGVAPKLSCAADVAEASKAPSAKLATPKSVYDGATATTVLVCGAAAAVAFTLLQKNELETKIGKLEEQLKQAQSALKGQLAGTGATSTSNPEVAKVQTQAEKQREIDRLKGLTNGVDSSEMAALKSELDRLKRSQAMPVPAGAAPDLLAIREKLFAAEEKQEQAEGKVAALTVQVSEAREVAAQLSNIRDQLETRLEAAESRLKAIEAEGGSLTLEMQAARNMVLRHQQEAAFYKSKSEELGWEIDSLQVQLENERKAHKQVQSQYEEAQATVKQLQSTYIL